MKKTIFSIDRALPCLFFNGLFHLNTEGKKYRQPISDKATISLDNEGTKFLALLSGREIMLEWLRRKRMIFSVTISLILIASLCANGQTTKMMPQLAVGDKVPNIEFATILNYSNTAITLSSLKGKAVILDFWATYCSACLIEFPKVDSLQKVYSKNLQIFLVNQYVKDDKKILADFLLAERTRIKNFSLPLVQNSAAIRNIFPLTSMPHYIWIGQDGRIKAITGPREVTGENISRLIAGLTLDLKTKLH